jgi:hypothetical protein
MNISGVVQVLPGCRWPLTRGSDNDVPLSLRTAPVEFGRPRSGHIAVARIDTRSLLTLLPARRAPNTIADKSFKLPLNSGPPHPAQLASAAEHRIPGATMSRSMLQFLQEFPPKAVGANFPPQSAQSGILSALQMPI